jgi:hypothetical protein
MTTAAPSVTSRETAAERLTSFDGFILGFQLSGGQDPKPMVAVSCYPIPRRFGKLFEASPLQAPGNALAVAVDEKRPQPVGAAGVFGDV